MAETPIDPDEIPRFEVRTFDGDQHVDSATFSTLEAAEAYAEAWTDDAPDRRADIRDLAHLDLLDEEVQADTAVVEDYPHTAPGGPLSAPDG